jgi:hypothetical protein
MITFSEISCAVMADRSFDPLPPGWGALSKLRPSRRRTKRWIPLVLSLFGLAVGLVLTAGLLARA